MVQSFWKAILNYAPKVSNLRMPFGPVIALLGLYPKEIVERGKGLIGKKKYIFIEAFLIVAPNWIPKDRLPLGNSPKANYDIRI